MANRDLVVRFIGDDRDLQRAFTTSERRAVGFQSRMTRLNQSLRGGLTGAGGGSSLLFGSGAFIGTAAITKGISESIEAASDLNEQLARSRQVFDESAVSIERWSKGLASSFGIAQSQALEFAGTFGLLFRNLGSSAPEAEKFSKQLVQLAADLASFNNTDVETTLSALRSGLTGEIEPLRKFGVFLSEARAQQEAFAKTGKRTASELTNQEKVLARLSIIMADTSRAQGDFARTSDGLANKQRIAAAEAQNLSASIGKALAPAMDIALISTIALTGGINDLIAGMENLRTSLRDTDAFDGWNEAVADATGGVGDFFTRVREGIPGLEDLKNKTRDVFGDAPGFSSDREAKRPGSRPSAAPGAEPDPASTQRKFDAFVKGLGLKFDKARLTKSLDDDIAVLRELERAIIRRIRIEGRTFELESLLTNTRLQIASIIDQSTAATEKVTSAGKKNKTAVDKMTAGEKQAAGASKRQSNQFEALGLTGEGDKRVPGVGALRRRLGSIRQQVEGTVLDTKQTETELDRMTAVLKGKFGKVGRDVRAAILDALNEISGAFTEGDRKLGPLTKTTSLNSKKILDGLGLSPEEIRELRGRLSNFNSAGIGNAGGNNRPSGGFTGGTGWVVENHVTVQIGNQKITGVVTKEQQKQRRRNPKQKRGPNRNR